MTALTAPILPFDFSRALRRRCSSSTYFRLFNMKFSHLERVQKTFPSLPSLSFPSFSTFISAPSKGREAEVESTVQYPTDMPPSIRDQLEGTRTW